MSLGHAENGSEARWSGEDHARHSGHHRPLELGPLTDEVVARADQLRRHDGTYDPTFVRLDTPRGVRPDRGRGTPG